MRRSEGHRQTPVEPRGQRPVVTPILSTAGLTGVELLMESPRHGESETPGQGYWPGVSYHFLLRCVRYRYCLSGRIPLDIQCKCLREKPEGKECPSTPDDGYDPGIAVDVDRLTIQRRHVLADPQLKRCVASCDGNFLCRRFPYDGTSGCFDDCPYGAKGARIQNDGSCLQSGGFSVHVHRRPADRQLNDTLRRRDSTIPEDAIISTSIQDAWSQGVDSKRGKALTGETSVYRRPRGAAVDGTEDATVGTRIQGGRGLGVDGKRGNALTGETSVHRCPGGTTVDRAKDTADCAGVQSGRQRRIDGKSLNTLVDKSTVHRCPRGAAVSGTENTTVCTRIQGGRGLGIDGKRGDALTGETTVHRCPRGTSVPRA